MIFDRLFKDMSRLNLAVRSADSRKWLLKKLNDLSRDTTYLSLRRDKSRQTPNSLIGRMYFFGYDPKLKKTLPYYDVFPLVIPVELYPDGFLGVNFHYLPPVYRAKLLDELSATLNNTKYNEKTRFQLTYQKLKIVAHSGLFRPCIKKYLFTHVKTSFTEVYANEYDLAIFLPVAKFVKATEKQVWNESLEDYPATTTKIADGRHVGEVPIIGKKNG